MYPDDQGMVRSMTLLLGIDDNSSREQILVFMIKKNILMSLPWNGSTVYNPEQK